MVMMMMTIMTVLTATLVMMNIAKEKCDEVL
jgi:hypothetical protein